MATTPTPRDAAVDVVQAAGAECNRSVPGEWDTTRWRAKQIVKALDDAGLLAPVSPVGADTPDAVERVAAAMWPGPPEWGSPVLEALGHAEQYRRMARAAIAAVSASGEVPQ